MTKHRQIVARHDGFHVAGKPASPVAMRCHIWPWPAHSCDEDEQSIIFLSISSSTSFQVGFVCFVLKPSFFQLRRNHSFVPLTLHSDGRLVLGDFEDS